MQKHFHIRRIRQDGSIKLFGKVWKPKGDCSHIISKYMCFGDYLPNDKSLICMWGTASLYYHGDTENEIGQILWKNNCELMGERQNNENLIFGSFMMLKEENKFISYKCRDIQWWYEV